jgi:hypothetical protein
LRAVSGASNDRIIGKLFNRARRHHEEHFQQSGKAINEKVRLFYRVGQALLKARQAGGDPFQAIEAVIGDETTPPSARKPPRKRQPRRGA